MAAKSKTCNGSTGHPLSEYSTSLEAQEAAEFLKSTHNKNLIPYQCDRCGLWHLSPTERQTPSSIQCKCRDRNGLPKALYETKEGARQRAKLSSREKGIQLTVYKCPHLQGFHLTRK